MSKDVLSNIFGIGKTDAKEHQSFFMAIYQRTGVEVSRPFPKTASTALTANTLCAFTSGQLVAATSTTTTFAGIIPRAVVAADDDYSSATVISVISLRAPMATFTIATTGAAATNVGSSYDLSDAGTLNLSGTTYKVLTVINVISATEVEVVPNFAAATFC